MAKKITLALRTVSNPAQCVVCGGYTLQLAELNDISIRLCDIHTRTSKTR